MGRMTKVISKTPVTSVGATRLDGITWPAPSEAPTVIVELDAPRGVAGPSLLERLSQALRGGLTLLRGRITRRSAWFRVKVRDSREVVRRTRSWRVNVRTVGMEGEEPSRREGR